MRLPGGIVLAALGGDAGAGGTRSSSPPGRVELDRSWRDNFDCVIALHIAPAFSIFHRGPRVDRGKRKLGTTVLSRMTLQCRRRKSRLAMESINDRYCRSPCGVMRWRGIPRAAWHLSRHFYSAETSKPRSVAKSHPMPSRHAQLAPRDSRSELREKLVRGVRERKNARGTLWGAHDHHE